MNQQDYLYRGFKNYRLQTEDNSCKRERRLLRKSNEELDKLTVKKYMCTIDDDWIIAIEEGLVYIEKAIAEERQFIRTNGETVPIEKAKKVSRDSVEHLARHSNMITHVPEKDGDPIIPDAIYMVEKLSDYAVYENRFLYMLLFQLREFISMRLDKITKLRRTYICDFEFKKELKNKYRNLETSNVLHEERFDNPYPLNDDRSLDLIKRIEDIEQIVVSMLNGNLMTEVSKAPMVKPPITKTNVLKMNNNFKNALALYNFICDYKKDGYQAEEVVKEFSPFSDEMADEFLELPMLLSHLTSKYGNEITEVLELSYQEEEERLRQLEAQKLLEQIARLKKKIIETGQGYEEYMIALEKRNKYLERTGEELLIAKNEIIALNKVIEEKNNEINELNRQIKALNLVIEEKNAEIARLNQKYIDDMNALTQKYEGMIEEINKNHEEEINELNNKHNDEMAELESSYENRISELKDYYDSQIQEIKDNYEQEVSERYSQLIETKEAEIQDVKAQMESIKAQAISRVNTLNEEINKLNEDHENEVNSLNDKMTELVDGYKNQINNLVDTSNETINNLSLELEELKNKYNVAMAQVHALKFELGKENNEDFTTREGFIQLEREFEFFNNFFKKEWKKTKKAIRKKLLWTKPEKKELKKEKDFKKERDLSEFDEPKNEASIVDEDLTQNEDNVEEVIVDSDNEDNEETIE